MFMRAIGAGLVITFSMHMVYGEAEVSETNVRNMAHAVRAIPLDELTRDHLPEGYEEDVLKQLRKDQSYSRLIRLRDRETMDKVIGRIIESQGKDRMLNLQIVQSSSPHFVNQLAPLLYLDDEVGVRTWGEHGEFDWGFTLSVADKIRRLIIRSPEFSDDFQEWARTRFLTGSQSALSGDDHVGRLRQWWEENEIHFENEDYHLVRPVSWDLQGDIEEEDLERFEEPGESESPGDDRPETEERTPAPDSGTREPGEDTPDRTIWLWGIGGIVLLVLVALGAFNLRSGRKGA